MKRIIALKSKLTITFKPLVCVLALLAGLTITASAQTPVTGNQPATKNNRATPPLAATSGSVTDAGTVGQIPKWTTTSGILGDSTISEDKFGHVGIGTSATASKLTVAGVIESTSGGVKFPDGTVQTTAATQSSSPKLQPFAHKLSAYLTPGIQSTTATMNVPAGKYL